MIKDESATIVQYDFHGDRLDVVPLPDGSDFGVCIRRLSQALSVDPDSQAKRLRRAAKKGALWAVTVKMTGTGSDGKQYKMLVLPRRSIPMWAATVSLAKVREDLRPGATEKLARYHDECADALADHFLGTRQAAPASPPSPLPDRTQVRSSLAEHARGALRVALLEHHIPALSRAGDVDGLRAAVAALDALLDHQRTPHTPTPAPRRPSRGHFDHDSPTGQLPDHRQSARPSGSEGSPTRAPRPPAKMRRKAPRATAPKDPAFAARIQAILDLRGWSSNKLGEAAGIGSGPMSKLRRRGPAEAGGATLTKVADAAGVELRWLVTGEGPMTSSTLN